MTYRERARASLVSTYPKAPEVVREFDRWIRNGMDPSTAYGWAVEYAGRKE